MPQRWRLLVLVPALWACARVAAQALPASSPMPQAQSIAAEPEPAEGALPRTPSGSTEHDVELPAADCPAGMVLLHRPQGPYCIDRYEASLMQRGADGTESAWPGNQQIHGSEQELVAVSVPGVKPQGYVSGDQAARVCSNAGKRLCEIDEWVRACRGPDFTRYPYGDQRTANACNDRYDKLEKHPVVSLFHQSAPRGTDPAKMWHLKFMNDPRLHEMPHSVSNTGAFEQCTNAYGVYDMVGNLHEWVADAEGTFLGGFFMDTYQNGEGCEYRTVAHPKNYHDYSTGFRCCSDP